MILAKINLKNKKFCTKVQYSSKCNCGSCNCNCGAGLVETKIDELICNQIN